MELDFKNKSNVEFCTNRISELFDSGIFNNPSNPLVNSAFIEVMICLRTLVYMCDKHAKRISFTDDVVITSSVKDVTDLIRYIRNAVCHIESPNHDIDNGILSFNVIYGYSPNFIVLNNKSYGSDFEDDICFLFGEQKIYLKRHIIKAFNEINQTLNPLLNESI